MERPTAFYCAKCEEEVPETPRMEPVYVILVGGAGADGGGNAGDGEHGHEAKEAMEETLGGRKRGVRGDARSPSRKG